MDVEYGSKEQVHSREVPVLRPALILLLSFPPSALAQRMGADTIVRTVQRPVHPGIATLVEELSIGVEDGAEEYMLGEIADIALGRDGSIYAFDRQVPVIRHYDAQGKFIRSIGRRGEGPGEYRSVSGLAVAPDGRLLVWDTGNWRINVYSPSGDVLTHWLTPSGSGGSSMATYARAMFVDHAGRVVTRKILFNAPDFLNRPTVWLRFNTDGRARDTLRAPRFRDVPKLMATSGRATVTRDVPFMPRRLVALSPLGPFIAGYPDRYAFEIHQPDGSIISIRREVKAEPVSRSERATSRREVEERMRQTDPTWSWDGPDIPDVKPLYADLQVALDGRIWVAVSPEVSPGVGTSSSGGGIGPSRTPRPHPQGSPPPDPRPALYDVFEPDGQYLGQVQVPARVSSVVRRGDTVWAIAWGDDDVPRIKRYRIAWRN